ncbi:type II secretion system F family protein [Nocardioides sp. CN2-186]|uniref:type II secretion system F family protein n=1 Tax=Nocardioides tweenelious TaxID=3156607 RepID=UPI0032B54A40
MSARPRAILAGVGIALASCLALATPSYADDSGATITHLEVAGDQLRVLVSVPADTDLDLAGVTASVDDHRATASAELAAGTSAVRRTSILVIDTSDSMSGARFTAARAAALRFLDLVPDDVYVGVVAFSSTVSQPLAPSLDRATARSVIAGLQLSHGTRLYDGVSAALDLAGTDGQRSLLILSDGADTTDTPLEDVADAVTTDGVLVDAVSLDSGPGDGGAGAALRTLARAGSGTVVSSDPAALRAAFSAEADALARQVLVRLDVPSAATHDEATVEVSIPSGSTTLTASAFGAVRSTSDEPDSAALAPADAGSSGLPSWVMYAGVAAVGVGLLLLLVLLVPARPTPLSLVERVAHYTSAGSHRAASEATPEAFAPVREAAAVMLSRNRSLEARIGRRLEGAGSELRPPEWVLLHAAVVVVVTILGLLLTGGSILVGLVFLVVGIVGPWVYLGFRRGRRRKAFNAALPDALQLMSGSLAAGLSLTQSVDTIVKEGLEPIASEFRRVLVEARLGVDLEDALEGVAERLDSKDLGWVVMAIRIQRPIGGNLAELLETVGSTMREREYMRRQVAALAAEGKLSAWVLGCLPPVFLLYLLVSNRDYVMPLFTTPMGLMMLTGAGLLLGVGTFWMSKMVKVDV